MHASLISMLAIDGNVVGAIGFAVFGLLAIGVMLWWIMTDPEKKGDETKE